VNAKACLVITLNIDFTQHHDTVLNHVQHFNRKMRHSIMTLDGNQC
jgi:hypothetical protein